MKPRPTFIPLLTPLALILACNGAPPHEGAPILGPTSASFSDIIPAKYGSCEGQPNISPALSWQSPPANTRSFALLVTDRDSPLGSNFVHWVLYNLPPEQRELPENLPKRDQLADGSRQGRNGFGNIGYGGPCPPGHSPHRYVFDLYALDAPLNASAGAAEKDVLQAMKGHILATGELVGRYQR